MGVGCGLWVKRVVAALQVVGVGAGRGGIREAWNVTSGGREGTCCPGRHRAMEVACTGARAEALALQECGGGLRTRLHYTITGVRVFRLPCDTHLLPSSHVLLLHSCPTSLFLPRVRSNPSRCAKRAWTSRSRRSTGSWTRRERTRCAWPSVRQSSTSSSVRHGSALMSCSWLLRYECGRQERSGSCHGHI